MWSNRILLLGKVPKILLSFLCRLRFILCSQCDSKLRIFWGFGKTLDYVEHQVLLLISFIFLFFWYCLCLCEKVYVLSHWQFKPNFTDPHVTFIRVLKPDIITIHLNTFSLTCIRSKKQVVFPAWSTFESQLKFIILSAVPIHCVTKAGVPTQWCSLLYKHNFVVKFRAIHLQSES